MVSVGVIDAPSSGAAQDLFRDFLSRWRDRVRIAGVIDSATGSMASRSGSGELRCIASGQVFPLFLPPSQRGGQCMVDQAGLAQAGHAVEGEIAAGCDLVILSKFGKMEAERSGLLSAFVAAIAAEVPVLSFVSPGSREAWDRFASPMFCKVDGRAETIDAWWREQSASRP